MGSEDNINNIIEQIIEQIKSIHQEITINKQYTEEEICIGGECRKEENFVERLVGVR